MTVFEAFAYYAKASAGASAGASEACGAADRGTVLRFVQRSGEKGVLPLPGLEPVAAKFDGTAVAAYADHWVTRTRAPRAYSPSPSLSPCTLHVL